jgi:hypothetical protein
LFLSWRLPNPRGISGKECNEIKLLDELELTAAGTVPDSHRIPFSFSATHGRLETLLADAKVSDIIQNSKFKI